MVVVHQIFSKVRSSGSDANIEQGYGQLSNYICKFFSGNRLTFFLLCSVVKLCWREMRKKGRRTKPKGGEEAFFLHIMMMMSSFSLILSLEWWRRMSSSSGWKVSLPSHALVRDHNSFFFFSFPLNFLELNEGLCITLWPKLIDRLLSKGRARRLGEPLFYALGSISNSWKKDWPKKRKGRREKPRWAQLISRLFALSTFSTVWTFPWKTIITSFLFGFLSLSFFELPSGLSCSNGNQEKMGVPRFSFFPAVRSFLSPFVSVSFLCAFIIEIAHDETFAKREKRLELLCYCIDNESSRVKRSFSSYPWGETVVVKEWKKVRSLLCLDSLPSFISQSRS